MSASKDPLQFIGTIVDEKYKIISLAGEGGFSAVYRAEHLVWNEPVAIKFFTLLGNAKPELREQLLNEFVQEGKLMTQLSSRSAAIVQARDIGRHYIDDDVWFPYMVLEWLDGEPLDKTLSREQRLAMPPRSLGEAISLLEPIAKALEVAHRQNVAHRDLKPANIVTLGDPREPGVPVKVLDFGIAKVMAEHAELQEQLQLTGQQITSFTPNYGAPEQFSRGYGATGPWTDVFAMALILLELLSGRRALAGSTLFDLGASCCNADKRPTPMNLGLQVPPEVEAVFAKAVTLSVGDRYPTMGEFWAALHSAVHAHDLNWKLTAEAQLSQVTGDAATQIGSSVDPSNGASEQGGSTMGAVAGTIPMPARSAKIPVIVGATAVLAIIGAGALLWSGADTASKTAPADSSALSNAPAAGSPPADATTPLPATASVDAEPTTAEASASASAAPSTSASPPKKQSKTAPQRVRAKAKTRPAAGKPAKAAKPAAPPNPKSGTDPWDPSTFGDR